MKLPKNRADVFAVTRGAAVCGIFPHFEDADEYAAECEQEFFERTGDYSTDSFKVVLTTFYNVK